VFAALEKYDLTRLAVGLDRYQTPTQRRSINRTMHRYGRGRAPLCFVIDADGTIRKIQTGVEGLEDSLGR